MKKSLIYLASLALIVAGCAKEVDITPSEKIEDASLVEYSFTAKLVAAELEETKGEMDFTNGNYSWKANDEIAIWDSQNGKFDTFAAESDGATTVFKGTGAADAVYTNAYYPASIASVAAGENAVVWPSSYSSADVAAKSFPLMATNASGELSFKHLGAILRLTIKDVPASVTAIEFASSSKTVSGTLAVDSTTPSEPKCVMGDGSSAISISSAAADRKDAASVFYLPLPTGTLTGGFSIKLKAGDSVVATQGTTANVAIARAKLIKMKAFAPEGAASGWSVIGQFNGWDLTTCTVMTEVLGHDNWVVARNLNTSGGFKFIETGAASWTDTNNYGYGVVEAINTQYQCVENSTNITTPGSSHDVYFNTDTKKFFIAEPGATWVQKTVYLMSDIEFDDSKDYYLNMWPASGTGLTTPWPGKLGSGTETISGIKYYKFEYDICDGLFSDNNYNCIFHTLDDAVRYDFRDGALQANPSADKYYLSFTSTTYNGNHGENNTNPMTQFADPAKPQGSSNWGVFVSGSLSRMHWDESPWLVYKNYVIGPDTELKINFNYDWRFYGPSTATVASDGTAFSVSQSNTGTFKVAGLTENYVCDVYLNIFTKEAKVVAQYKENATIKLYFGVPNYGTYVNYYTFNGGTATAWPGVAMTDYEVINDVRYYYVEVPASSYWDTDVHLIVVSDGITYSQTHDFLTADWSGRLDEYYFLVVDRDIVQQTRAEARWTYSSQFSGVNWSSVSWLGSSRPGYLADWKVTSDATNIYFLFKIPATGVGADKYIYSGYNTDNDSTTGTNAGGGVNGGYEAMSLLYPFTTDSESNVVCKNGTDNKGKVACPVGTTVSGVKPETYGVIRSDYAYVEMKLPRTAIGSPTGTIGIQHSYNWGEAGEQAVVLN